MLVVTLSLGVAAAACIVVHSVQESCAEPALPAGLGHSEPSFMGRCAEPPASLIQEQPLMAAWHWPCWLTCQPAGKAFCRCRFLQFLLWRSSFCVSSTFSRAQWRRLVWWLMTAHHVFDDHPPALDDAWPPPQTHTHTHTTPSRSTRPPVNHAGVIVSAFLLPFRAHGMPAILLL